MRIRFVVVTINPHYSNSSNNNTGYSNNIVIAVMRIQDITSNDRMMIVLVTI